MSKYQNHYICHFSILRHICDHHEMNKSQSNYAILGFWTVGKVANRSVGHSQEYKASIRQ